MKSHRRSPSVPHVRRDHSLNSTIGEAIRALRLHRELTQQQLAKMTGIERAFISELERGVKGITMLTFYRLATALNTAPHIILRSVDPQIWPLVESDPVR